MPKAKKAAVRKSETVIYPEHKVELRGDKNPLTVDEAKELLGWTEEDDGEDWGKEFDFKDKFNRKVRLTRNPSNRPFKIATAMRYASEFLRGVWHFNGESIVFGRSGELRDGQHRLVSFVLADQMRHINQAKWGSNQLTFPCLLAFGFSDEKEVADSYDTGRARSLTDVIYRHETLDADDKVAEKVSRHLGEAIRLVWLRSGGKTVSSAPHFPHSEAMDFYKEHPQILDSVKFILDADAGSEGNEKLLKPLMSLSYCAALHYLMSDVNSEKADEFWLSVAQGEGLKKGDPALTLRGFLTKSEAGSGKQRDRMVIATVKAWLAFLAGEKLTPAAVRPKEKNEEDNNGNTRRVLAEFPRIGGIDSEPESPEELEEKEQIILSALADAGDEVTVDEIQERSGLSKSSVAKIAYSGEGQTLLKQGLVEVNEYESDEGASVLYVKITEAGTAQVR